MGKGKIKIPYTPTQILAMTTDKIWDILKDVNGIEHELYTVKAGFLGEYLFAQYLEDNSIEYQYDSTTTTTTGADFDFLINNKKYDVKSVILDGVKKLAGVNCGKVDEVVAGKKEVDYYIFVAIEQVDPGVIGTISRGYTPTDIAKCEVCHKGQSPFYSMLLVDVESVKAFEF